MEALGLSCCGRGHKRTKARKRWRGAATSCLPTRRSEQVQPIPSCRGFQTTLASQEAGRRPGGQGLLSQSEPALTCFPWCICLAFCFKDSKEAKNVV